VRQSKTPEFSHCLIAKRRVGILQWGGRLVGVTSDVKDLGFSSGNPPYLTCLARNMNGGFVTTKFELSEMNVSNNNGAFSIDTRGGPHDPRTVSYYLVHEPLTQHDQNF
jgi:hypothetical protein